MTFSNVRNYRDSQFETESTERIEAKLPRIKNLQMRRREVRRREGGIKFVIARLNAQTNHYLKRF